MPEVWEIQLRGGTGGTVAVGGTVGTSVGVETGDGEGAGVAVTSFLVVAVGVLDIVGLDGLTAKTPLMFNPTMTTATIKMISGRTLSNIFSERFLCFCNATPC